MHLRTSDWPVMLSDRLATDLRPEHGRLELPVSLGTSLRPTYDRAERHTRQPSESRPTCKDLRPKEDPAASWVTRKWNWQVSRPFLTVKGDRGACRFHWRVGPSYCENPGVTYDLLVGNIGGTYDLADQLPSDREFGHFSVVSQSQVPREFGVNLALLMMNQHWFRLWLGAVRLQTIAWANVAPDLCHHTA